MDNLFKEIFETKVGLRLRFLEIVNSMESNLLKIARGCIEFRLQALSYAALLNLSLQFVKGGSEGIKQLPPLHQKLRDTMGEELSSGNITTANLSFTNYFEGGSYRSALEFFCGGFAIDDMLPIIKKRLQFQNIDYLCIDMRTAPQTTLSDLRGEFVKHRHRKLHELERKVLKEKTLSKSDYKLISKLIHNILNKSDKGHGQELRKDEVKALPGNKVKKVIEKEKCQEKQRGKNEKSKTRKREKVSKDLTASGKRVKVMEGLESPGIKVERIQELETPGKKMMQVLDFKLATMEMKKVQELGFPGIETHKLEPSVEKMHTSDPHAQKLETSLNYEPSLKPKNISEDTKQFMEKASQKISSPTMRKKEARQLKPKKESKQTKDRNRKGNKVKKVIEKEKCQEKQRGKSEKSKTQKREKVSKDLTASGKRVKVMEGLESPGIKVERIQELETPGKKMMKILDFKPVTMEMKKVQELGFPGIVTHKLEPSVEKMHTSDPHAQKLETSFNYEPPLKPKNISEDTKQFMEKASQKISSPTMRKKEARQLKPKKESKQTKDRNQKGQIDFGQEASTSKMKEHIYVKKKTDRKQPTDLDSIVTIQQLKRLAGNLGNEWKNLATEGLGISKTVLQRMERDKTGPKDRALGMLMAWRKQGKCNPTIRNLIDALNKGNISSDSWRFLIHKIDTLKEKQTKTFEVVIRGKLKKKPKKCYGCSKQLLEEENSDLILKTQDVRTYYGPCQQRHLAFQASNVYFHLLEKCVQKKYGLFNLHKFIVPNSVMACLTSKQLTTLQGMNIIQDAGGPKPKTEKID
ncbi:uncharacterized protein LOC121279591 isoform X2 [Carcharodon carcharias]|nr:uncharacterized protein LOC121279591 isoform X2 [Carcharodon carcharias]XP_041046666.1 uncharacterized protein LOC121279591 isoform X2 [Carcharodon carcharias]